MARTNDACGAWVVELLNVASNESVLEIGFGPGTATRRLSVLPANVAGVDPSREMVAQPRARNATVIEDSRVELRRGSVDDLPFADDTFHEAMAINSMQIWPDADAVRVTPEQQLLHLYDRLLSVSPDTIGVDFPAEDRLRRSAPTPAALLSCGPHPARPRCPAA
jgi:SAM-dependent methyltransferase